MPPRTVLGLLEAGRHAVARPRVWPSPKLFGRPRVSSRRLPFLSFVTAKILAAKWLRGRDCAPIEILFPWDSITLLANSRSVRPLNHADSFPGCVRKGGERSVGDCDAEKSHPYPLCFQ
jgi:hypothetical protein